MFFFFGSGGMRWPAGVWRRRRRRKGRRKMGRFFFLIISLAVRMSTVVVVVVVVGQLGVGWGVFGQRALYLRSQGGLFYSSLGGN